MPHHHKSGPSVQTLHRRRPWATRSSHRKRARLAIRSLKRARLVIPSAKHSRLVIRSPLQPFSPRSSSCVQKSSAWNVRGPSCSLEVRRTATRASRVRRLQLHRQPRSWSSSFYAKWRRSLSKSANCYFAKQVIRHECASSSRFLLLPTSHRYPSRMLQQTRTRRR